MFVNSIEVNMFLIFVFECNLTFGVDSCAEFHVLLQPIIFLVLFYPWLQLVYFMLYILL